LSTDVTRDADDTIIKPGTDAVEPFAAALEHDVGDILAGNTKDVADGRAAFRLSDADRADRLAIQPGEPIRS
jgi:gamma-glutamyl phosphate reductase